MPLVLRRQGIEMLPLQGGFVKAGRPGEVGGNAGELVAREDRKGVGPDVLERGRVGNLVVGKQLEHVPRLLQRVVALGAGGIHALFRGGLGRLRILPDVRQEAGNQVVMEALITMDDKTQEIEIGGRVPVGCG
jgi:hypothetical protein